MGFGEPASYKDRVATSALAQKDQWRKGEFLLLDDGGRFACIRG